MQGIDPVTGPPTPLPSPIAEDIVKDELAKASEQAMTLDKPGVIPVDKLGSGGNGNKRRKDCKCPTSHYVMAQTKKGLMMKYTPYMNKTQRDKRAKKEYEEKVKQGLIT